uniref:Uncharacterized protein n=1 Tax=Moniliophthora roreri TaxID=221103 RepID=A0A0W0F3N2_MONRR
MVDHEKQLQQDLTAGMVKILRENPGIKPEDAMRQVSKDMLANTPFIAPKGCPVNNLPNELLAQIFHAGVAMDDEDDEDDDFDDDEYDDTLDVLEDWETESDLDEDEGPHKRNMAKGKHAPKGKESAKDAEDDEGNDEDEEHEPRIPFQVLVSHVCRHWREVAIGTPTLWTAMNFTYGSSIEAAKVWVERSKTQPLEIHIDCSLPGDWMSEDDLPEEDDDEMDVASGSAANNADTDAPKPPRPELPVPSKEELYDHYDRVYAVLERLAQCPPAVQLETLELYNHDDVEEFELFDPPELKQAFLLFEGEAPKLKECSLWGVHLDWVASLSFFQGLSDLQLAYHANEVRPSFETFSKMLTSSLDLQTVSLALSGPAGPKEDWPTTPIDLSHVKELVLHQHEIDYILALLPLLHIPNVISLSLDFDGADYTELAHMLSIPIGERKTSILSGIQFLKITEMPCNNKAREAMMEQLINLKTLNLNCSDDEEEIFFKLLMKTSSAKPADSSKPSVLYCPNLSAIYTTGVSGTAMRKFVEARRSGGVPLKKVGMSGDDEVDNRDEKWLKDNVDEFEYFEPESDYEDGFIEVADDEMLSDGEDMMEMDDDDDDQT